MHNPIVLAYRILFYKIKNTGRQIEYREQFTKHQNFIRYHLTNYICSNKVYILGALSEDSHRGFNESNNWFARP